MRNVLLIFTLAVFFLSYFGVEDVSAIGGVTNTSYSSETYTPVNGSISTTAGYIYQYNLSITEPTYRWVGIWGNITGDIRLSGVSAQDAFYTWNMNTVTAGSILYATTFNGNLDPTGFDNTTTSNLNDTDTQYGFSSSVIDSVWRTYDSASSFSSPSMDNTIDVNSTTVNSWTNYFIKRTSGAISSTDDAVWAVGVNPNQVAYNSQRADFELMVPENEEAGDGEGAATTYYLWVELN